MHTEYSDQRQVLLFHALTIVALSSPAPFVSGIEQKCLEEHVRNITAAARGRIRKLVELGQVVIPDQRVEHCKAQTGHKVHHLRLVGQQKV